MIKLDHIAKTYQRGDGSAVNALVDVSFSIEPGEFVTIRGASGSGKSSLLNILGCLDTPSSGSFLLDGEDVSKFSDEERSKLRSQKIGFVFQSFNLLPRTTVAENVELPALYAEREPDRAKALSLLARVGLDQRSDHFSTELSGGEQQRVAIARALMNDPDLILADEPTGNLDSVAGQSVMELLTSLNEEGKTIILVTHDEETASFARRTLMIKDGRIADTIADTIALESTG